MPIELKSQKVIPFPSKAVETVSKQSKSSGANLAKKAYDAYHNAKQRCGNANHPSFAEYGGSGIKFLFQSFQQFLDDVGLPKAGLSLDRIDPCGHYEPGNVRWANKHVQAANKVGHKAASLPPIADLVAKYESAAAKPVLHAHVTEAWRRCIAALTRGYFAQSDLEFFQASYLPATLFTAGWEMGQVRDQAVEPSHFHLPALTWPGKIVQVRGGPWHCPLDASEAYGTLPGLGSRDIGLSVPSQLRAWVNEDVRDLEKAGGAWVGQVNQHLLECGGVEGWMLAAASTLRSRGFYACFIPALDALSRLKELGHPHSWQETADPLLDSIRLFIPDLQLDVGHGFELGGLDASQLGQLLAYRREYGLKTFVGVQNPHKLSEKLKLEILGKLRVRQLEELPQHSLSNDPGPTLTEPKPTLKPGRFGFAEMFQAISV